MGADKLVHCTVSRYPLIAGRSLASSVLLEIIVIFHSFAKKYCTKDNNCPVDCKLQR